MCNLYRLETGPEALAHFAKAIITKPVEWGSFIYPRYEAPVVLEHEGERRIGPMRWGFPTKIRGKSGKMLDQHVTNARNLASNFWKGAAANPVQRCLVPFTRFAEPKPGKDREGRPAQYWFSLPDRPIAMFAGLWRNTDDGPVYAFLTCEPNPLVAPLHPKAMPVILMTADWDRWLHGGYDDVLELQAPFPSQMMAVE